MTTAAAPMQTPVEDTHPPQSALALNLLSITNDLTGVLNEESSALSKGKAGTIEALGQRKTDLFAFYARAIEDIQKLGQTRLDIDDALRASLRTATLQFKSSLERNQRLLKGQLEVSKGMMQSIGREAERQQNPVKTYANPNASKQTRAPTSLALNQTI